MGGILAALGFSFLVGAAARWIVPGPDPMPAWLTAGFGLGGSLAGGGVAAAAFGPRHVMTSQGHVFTTVLLEIGAATALVAAYRRFVQHRAITGGEARAFPERGIGIQRTRARLLRLGVDPDRLGDSRPDEKSNEDSSTH